MNAVLLGKHALMASRSADKGGPNVADIIIGQFGLAIRRPLAVHPHSHVTPACPSKDAHGVNCIAGYRRNLKVFKAIVFAIAILMVATLWPCVRPNEGINNKPVNHSPLRTNVGPEQAYVSVSRARPVTLRRPRLTDDFSFNEALYDAACLRRFKPLDSAWGANATETGNFVSAFVSDNWPPAFAIQFPVGIVIVGHADLPKGSWVKGRAGASTPARSAYFNGGAPSLQT